MLLAGLLGLATFVVHDLDYVFGQPFWNDEAWVAISTKLPLGQLTEVSVTTPVGWSFLLRLVVIGGEQRLRVVPLLFAALTVVAAYVYARTLPWRGVLLARLAGVLAGLAALLVPSALARDDLKQYTADAFVTLVVLALVSRADASGSTRRLVTLALVTAVGFLFSATTVFVGVAGFGGLLLVAGARRQWRAAGAVTAAGAAVGAVLLATYLLLYRPGIPTGVNDYWAAYYLPVAQGWSASLDVLTDRSEQLATYLGMGPLVVALLLLAAGTATLVALRRVALALVVPLLVVEAVGLAALKQYPLFDLRTSHFLTTALAVTAAIGVAGVCALAARLHLAVTAVIAVGAVLLFVTGPGIRENFRSRTAIPAEDLRTPTRYLAAHHRPGDVIVLNMLSSWGFAYYWPTGTPVRQSVSSNLQRFVTVYPDQPGILVAQGRDAEAVDAVMAKAVATVRPGGRIWFEFEHTVEPEVAEFQARIAAFQLDAVTVAPGLMLLTPPTG